MPVIALLDALRVHLVRTDYTIIVDQLALRLMLTPHVTVYEYESVEHATKPEAFLTKIDLKSGYRHAPIHPSNYINATGLK